MYDTSSMGLSAEKCKEPDWEAEAAKEKSRLDIIKKFKASLLEFIGVIGSHSLRHKENSSIQELLGTVVLDIIERETHLADLMEKLKK